MRFRVDGRIEPLSKNWTNWQPILQYSFFIVCATIIHLSQNVLHYFTPWNYRNTWWARLRNQHHVIADKSVTNFQRSHSGYRQSGSTTWKRGSYCCVSSSACRFCSHLARWLPLLHSVNPSHQFNFSPGRNVGNHNYCFTWFAEHPAGAWSSQLEWCWLVYNLSATTTLPWVSQRTLVAAA